MARGAVSTEGWRPFWRRVSSPDASIIEDGVRQELERWVEKSERVGPIAFSPRLDKEQIDDLTQLKVRAGADIAEVDSLRLVTSEGVRAAISDMVNNDYFNLPHDRNHRFIPDEVINVRERHQVSALTHTGVSGYLSDIGSVISDSLEAQVDPDASPRLIPAFPQHHALIVNSAGVANAASGPISGALDAEFGWGTHHGWNVTR